MIKLITIMFIFQQVLTDFFKAYVLLTVINKQK